MSRTAADAFLNTNIVVAPVAWLLYVTYGVGNVVAGAYTDF